MIKNLFEKAPQEKGPFQYLVAVWDSSKRGFLAKMFSFKTASI
jgi:hypothetical protein